MKRMKSASGGRKMAMKRVVLGSTTGPLNVHRRRGFENRIPLEEIGWPQFE